MNHDSLQEIGRIFNDSHELLELIEQSSDFTFVPYRKSAILFLAVSALVKEQCSTQRGVVSTLETFAKLVGSIALNRAHWGVEVLLCGYLNGNTVKIVRMGIPTSQIGVWNPDVPRRSVQATDQTVGFLWYVNLEELPR